MGIFFSSKAAPCAAPEPSGAPKTETVSVQVLPGEAITPSRRSTMQVTRQFSWARFACALIIVVIILAAGIFTASMKMDDWSKMLLHSFELVLGLVLGILGGEAAAQR